MTGLDFAPLPRVIIADDHAGLVEEITLLVRAHFLVVASPADGAGLLQAAIDLKPDVVVSDIGMPVRNGLEVGIEIVRRGICGAVVLLTADADNQLIRHAFDGGIRGYVVKEDAGEELLPAMESVLAGRHYLSSNAKRL